MELLQLKYFCHVAQTGSMTKSARALYISQPALSRAISSLEKELGVKLFDRIGRGITLNAFGSFYYQQISSALQTIENASHQIFTHKKQAAGDLYINLLTTPPRFSTLVSAFCAQYPDIRLHISKQPSLQVAFDLAFLPASCKPAGKRYHSCVVCKEEAVVAVYPTHPWAGRTQIEVNELAEQPLILPRPGRYSFYRFCQKLFSRFGITPTVSAWSSNSYTTKTLVESGAGITLFTRSLTDAVYKHSLCILPFAPPCPYEELLLLWPKNRTLSTQASCFCEFCHQFFPAP